MDYTGEPAKLFEFGGFFVLSAFFAPIAVFDKLELVGGVGFVFLGEIVLSSTDRTSESNENSRCFFCFGHG